MANVDNLNFKVIIDDAQFNKKIKAMEDMAKRFNTSVSNILNIKAVSQDLVVSNRKMRQMETDNLRAAELQNREKIKTEGLQRKINAQIEKTTKGYQSQSRILQELKGYALGYLSIHGATQLLSSLVRVTGEFELQKTTLAAMLGDLNQAETIIARIQGLAVESPFQFKELTTYAKQLSAFSVPAQELYDTTKMLADISAGLGVGMDRIVLAYGQVRSAAFLRGQEVRQFTEAGIPILDELAKQFTELEGRAVSTGEVFDKISARLVPFEMVAKVLKEMTSEGGKFYQMQEIQAETLKGKISNLKDAYEVMLNEIGSAHSDKLKGAVDGVRNLMQNWEKIGGQLVGLIKLFGTYKVAVGLLKISDTIAQFGGLARAIQHTAVAQKILNSALMTNPYIAVATAITAIAIAINGHRKSLGDISAIQRSYNSHVKELERLERERVSTIRNLIDIVQDEARATIEREHALMSLKKAYPEIFAQYDIESLKLADILKIKKQIAEEDAKRRKIEAYGAIGAQQGRIKALISQGAGNSQKEAAWKLLEEKEKYYLENFVLPDIVAGLKDMTDEVLQKALQDAFRNSQYNIRGLEKFDGIPTTKGFYEDLYAAIQAEVQRRKSIKPVDGWRKKVQDLLSEMSLDEGHSFGLWVKDTTDSVEYIDNLVKRYKELNEQIGKVSSFDPNLADDMKKELNVINAVAKALNIDIKNLAAKDGDTWESKEEKRINRLIEDLRKLQDQYEKLKALGVSDQSIKSLFEGMFPELVEKQGKEFVTGLNYVDKAKTLIEQLRKLNPESADKALLALNADNTADYEKKLDSAIRATQRYYESIRRLESEDFNLDGKGIALDISKVASDLSSKTKEIDLNARKLKENLMSIDLRDANVLSGVKDAFNKEFGEGSWDVFYAKFLSEGEKAIKTFSGKQKEYEKKLAQEKINDLASKYVGEKIGGLNLSDWGDKSLSQIEYIRQRLIALMNEDIKLPESLVKTLSELGLSTDLLSSKIKELFGEWLQNATVEKFKELADVVGEVTSKASELGSQLIELGDTVDSDFLRSFGKSLQFANELTDMLLECDSLMDAFAKSGEKAGEEVSEIVEETGEITNASKDASKEMENIGKSSDWVTMVIKLAISLIGKVVNGINESQQALHEARLAAIEYNNALKQIEFDRLLGGSESIFGTDEYGQFKTSMQEAEKYLNNIKEAQKQVGVTNKELAKTYVGPNAALFGDTEDVAKVWGHQIDDIIVDSRTSWQKFWGTGKDALKSFNMSDFLDEDGILDGEKLREFYNAYGDDISGANKEAIEEMLGDWDLYVQAIDNVTSYLTDMFGQVADEMADAFINSFKESGQAALEYGDIMSDVATNIAKSVIKSTILQNVFSEKDAELAAKKLGSGDVAGAVSIIDEAMQAAQDLTPYIQGLLESLKPYFDMEQTEGQTLGDGIKGITEDTANLLASYLNAIRADVSYARTIWERMDVTTQQIAVMLSGFSAPSLMEYQMQIAANTYNTAMNTQSIMEDLRSVITSTDGPTGIRVYS